MPACRRRDVTTGLAFLQARRADDPGAAAQVATDATGRAPERKRRVNSRLPFCGGDLTGQHRQRLTRQ